MSLRTTLSRTTTKRPKSHISLVLCARSTSTPKLIITPQPHRRTLSSTSTTRKSVSLIGRFFGARDPLPAHQDPARAVRDAADTLYVLLRTSPPVRPALLHKPYADLVAAVLAYDASRQQDPLDLTTAVQSFKASVSTVDLAGDPTNPSDPLGYFSILLSHLTSPPYPHPAELELALKVHEDMVRIFEREPKWEDTLCVVRAYALLRRPKEALEIASTMNPPPPGDAWAPIASAIILGSTSAGSEMRTMMRTMAARGIDPPAGAWCALLSAVQPEEVPAILKALPENVREEPRVWAAALEVLVRGRSKEVNGVAKTLRKLLESRGVVDTKAWAALVVYAGTKTGKGGEEDGPYGVVKAFERAGGVPDLSLLQALISALPLTERTPEVLRRLENVVGVAADETAWGVLIDAALEREEAGAVTDLWEAAREGGVSLTSANLDRVVAREDVPVVERLRVYRAVHAAWPVGQEIVQQRKKGDIKGVDAWMKREDALSTPGPTISTYSALLGALASGRGGLDKMTASAAAVELLTDMRQRGIKFPELAQTSIEPRSNQLSPLAALTVLLMRGAPSHEAAFKMYAYARVVDPSGGSFGAREYKQVMRAFAELRVARTEEEVLREGRGDNWADRAATTSKRVEIYAPPPAALYYEIMRDMQKAGHHVGLSEYGIILKAYAAVSIPADSDSQVASAHNGHVLEHIQRIHTLLKLDTNLTPDTVLLNTLMNAYGYAGAVDSSLAVWDQMKWPGNKGEGGGGGTAARDNASISIVLDALGRSGRRSLPRARQMWDTLRRRHGRRLNANNYTSWVEALCRMGEFSEAERVVFVDMREKVRPDEKTLRTLVSFSWRVGRQVQVLEDVRREFPGVI